MPGATSGFGYASASRTQPLYQPQSSHSTWCKDRGVVIRANDFLDDLEAASEKEREIRSRFGLDVDHLPELQVHDESKDILKTFEEIEERLGTWEIRFDEFVAYKEEYGDCIVSFSKNPKLASWIKNQRAHFRQEKLSQERIDRLNAIGFVWVVWDANSA